MNLVGVGNGVGTALGSGEVQLTIGGLKISIHSHSHRPAVSLYTGCFSGMHIMPEPEQPGEVYRVGSARAEISVEGSPGLRPGIHSHVHLPVVALYVGRCSEMQ